MKKILIIDLGKSYGGAEKLIENIINELKDNIEFTLLLDKNGEFLQRSNSLNDFKIITFNNNIKTLIINIIKIIKLVKYESYDVVHCHGTPSNLFGIILKRVLKIRVISTIHSDLEHEFTGKKKRIYLRIEKETVKSFDYVTVVSKNLQQKLNNRCNSKSRNNIKLIYNGINVNTHIEPEFLGNEEFKILFVGRLVEIKNIPLLLNTLAKIRKKYTDFKCYIIGEGDEENKLKELTKSIELEKNVCFLGFKNNIEGYMKSCDVLIMTSKMEGIPLTIIEAFANKLPVVSTEVGGVKEMISHNETGILFKSESAVELEKILLDIIARKYNLNDISENAYKEYKNKWKSNVMSTKYYKLYCSMM